MAAKKLDLQTLISYLWKANKIYGELTGVPTGQKLGAPAQEADISQLEAHWQISLPDDYKQFLQCHNGWQEFEEESNILAVKELLGKGKIAEWLKELKHSWGPGDARLRHGLVIVAGDGLTSAVYFDASAKPKKAGGLTIVEWADGEVIDTYPSFTHYLAATLDVLNELIEDERGLLE